MNPLDPENSPTPATEQPTTTETPTTTPDEAAAAALERLAVAGGENFDRSQMDALKEKLAKLGKSEAKTISGSEAPDEPVKNGGQPASTRPLTGLDVDWSEYDLDYNLLHLYKKAVYRPTPQGPKWVAMVTDFTSTTRDFKNHGKKVNVPGAVDKNDTEYLNLGEYLNDMINGKEQWKIAALMPAGPGQCGLLLERELPIILPDPQRLKKSEEVEAPTEPALAAVEDAALNFMKEQGGENELDNEATVGEDTTTPPTAEDIGLRPIERGSDAHEQALSTLDESGAVQARVGAGVAKALATAAPETTAAPTAGVVQPAAVEGNDFARSALNPEGKVPAAGYSAAQELLRALSDPNFRAQLPKEE